MHLDERFDDLAASLGGFYRAWVIHLGLELGFFAVLRRAGAAGTDSRRSWPRPRAPTRTRRPAGAWPPSPATSSAGTASARRLDDATATILLDVDRPEYLGGQFVHSVTASLDTEDLVEHLRTGRTVTTRPPRYHRSIELLTRQDIAVFFEEALAAIPNLVTDLVRGIDVVDLHCGGGRWLVAVARRFPACRLVGVESEPDSTARARRVVGEAGLEGRDPDRAGRGRRHRARRRVRPRLLPARAPRAAAIPSRRSPRHGGRSGRAAACSSWAGACRPTSTTWRRCTASSSRGSRSTSRSTADASARSRSTRRSSPPLACRSRARSRCPRTPRSSSSSGRPERAAPR